MARSSGYRYKQENAEEVKALRKLLHACTTDQWQRASGIMQDICAALGKPNGPSGSVVLPRSCKICYHYGHTAQHCPIGENPYEKARREHLQALHEKHANPTPEFYDEVLLVWCWDQGRLRKLEWGETLRSGGNCEPNGKWEYPGIKAAQQFHRVEREQCCPCEGEDEREFYLEMAGLAPRRKKMRS